jgi:hypothetical protein
VDSEGLRQLQDALIWIDALVRDAAARAQAAGHDPTDALRGLVITDVEVNAYLERSGISGMWENDTLATLEAPPGFDDTSIPFGKLISLFGLEPIDAIILLLCVAPEVDRRYERLYAYLQDDVSQRRPTVNLMMNVMGADLQERFAVWDRLSADRPLRQHYIIDAMADPSHTYATFLAHYLKLDHRVLMFLLGEHTPDARLKNMTTLDSGEALAQGAIVPPSMRIALHPHTMVYLQGEVGMGRRDAAAAVCAEQGYRLLSFDLAALKELDIPFAQAWKLAMREAALNEAALLVSRWESVLNSDGQPPADLWRALLNYPRPVFICGHESWETLDTQRERRMLRITFSLPNYDERRKAWEHTLSEQGIFLTAPQLDEIASKFKLTSPQISRAVNTAADLAASRGEAVSVVDLVAGSQAHSSLRLGKLAKKVVPRFTWTDLVLPADRLEQLHEVCDRVRFAHVVNESWGFQRRVAAAPGVTTLFAGESGTGKTLAAEIIAADLGLLLYKIDLSAVVSKYIGETEKNLGAIFEEAHQSNAVLFFDEADALFGKRSEVKDAHDRYANLEVAYLLQQLETYEGVAILATNLRQNLDEAFTRRLGFLIDFPFPEKEYRAHLWASHFPPEAPVDTSVDLTFLADRFPLAGGNIRNAAIASAYLAAADGGVITLQHVRHAIRREHQKMGRLLDDNL